MTSVSASSNRRLAKNTVLLYLRTLVVLAISLYTSRVILATLGIENYGIYNVIGGFVSMFALAGGTLVSATQRFLNFEIGKREHSDPNKVFCVSMGIHFSLSLFLLLLFETFGLWFLNSELNIPSERLFAANIVYQCSVLAFLVNIISIPYNAVIIANERMGAFAYISLLDAVLKLLIAYALYLSGFDKLIVYAILLLLIALLIRLIYGGYCKRHFPEISRFRLVRDGQAYKRQIGFASFTFLGSSAAILSSQGVNVVMNLFCGVAVNAARGIAVQVQHATEKFVTDFMTALNPQITKTYAAGEKGKSIELVYRGARFSFILMLFFSLPIIFRTHDILDFWLVNYPQYSVEFVRLTLLYSLVTLLSRSLTTEILATGQIKTNALVIGGVRLSILPLCYIVLSMGYDPTSCYYVMIIVDMIALYARLYIVRSLTGFAIADYFRKVIRYVVPVFVLSFFLSYVLDMCISANLVGLLSFIACSVLCTGIVSWSIGLDKAERSLIKGFIIDKIRKK